MSEFSNPRKVAERLRMATTSIVDPHDIAIVRQYIYELELIAREQDLSGVTGGVAECQNGCHSENGTPPDSLGEIAPLTRLPLHGNLKMISDAGERPRKWVLKLDDFSHPE